MQKAGENGIDLEKGELYTEFERLKPRFANKNAAIAAASSELEKTASTAELSVEEFLREAHTTTRSEPHHLVALQLERQLNFLRR